MASLVKSALLVLAMALSIMLCFRTMNAMMVRSNTTVILSAKACPVPLTEDAQCLITGSVSNSFLSEDVEIRLLDGSVMLVPQTQVLAQFRKSDEKVSYEPFGSLVAFLIGILIIGSVPL